MDRLSCLSQTRYRALLEHSSFMQFFSQATPIDAIESSRIGSRPPRRTGKRTLQDLRAIPWVFSWNQSRFVLPGWFGIGTALETLVEEEPAALDRLLDGKREHSGRWPPLHYLISNVATAWMTASPRWMNEYSQLVTDPACADAIQRIATEEYALTGKWLERIYEAPLREARPRIHQVLRLREEALEPLHREQLALLREWRREKETDSSAADRLLPQLLLSINAIAAGLGTTG